MVIIISIKVKPEWQLLLILFIIDHHYFVCVYFAIGAYAYFMQ
jgi:hypothetical protein